jgi:hypothetical protein
MKRIAPLLVVTWLGIAAMVSANASTGSDDLGKVRIGTTDEFAFASTKPPAHFLDSVNFDLNSADAVVTDTLTLFGVKTFGVALYNDTTSSYVFQCTSGCALTDSFSDLTQGDDYSLVIAGKTGGKKGSNSLILGTLAVTSAVPEPSTLMLLIAGLGLVGIARWRRHRTPGARRSIPALAVAR